MLEEDIAGAQVKIGMHDAQVFQFFQVAKFLASHTINPLAQSAAIVTSNNANLQAFLTFAFDMILQAFTPFGMSVERAFDVQSFRAFFFFFESQRGRFLAPFTPAQSIKQAHFAYSPLL